jgi:hypothetical protein
MTNPISRSRTRRLPPFLTGLALLVALAGCDLLTVTPAVYADVDVLVLDDRDRPIQGAGVEAVRGGTRHAVGHTGADGRVRLTYLPVLPHWEYRIIAHPPGGYVVADDAARQRTLQPTEAGTLSVTLHLATPPPPERPDPGVAQRVRERRGQ